MQMNSEEKIVLDAWAVLALVFGEEPAASHIKNIFERKGISKSHVHMSWINLGEVYYMIARRKGQDAADEVLKDIQLLPIKLHLPSKDDILAAAGVKANHKLSYADAFAVSLAKKIHATIYTGDPEIISLGSTVKIRQLSRAH